MTHFTTIFEQELEPSGFGVIPSSAPYLKQLIDHLNERQLQTNEVLIRGFQADIIQSGFFTIPSPYDEAIISSGESITLPDRTTFYRFPSEPRLLLAAANLGRGYPIVGIILLDSRTLIQIQERNWGVQASHVSDVCKILAQDAWAKPRAAKDCYILTGDPNFAHHAWNHLGALSELSRLRIGRSPLPIFVTFQPLGPLVELLPELSDWPVSSISAMIPACLNAPGRVIVNIGGFRVTDGTRERVLKVACAHASIETKLALLQIKSRWPIIWVSVRTRNRTAENQRSFVTSLCKEIYTTNHNAAIIIDGHSLPVDQENCNYEYTELNIAVEKDSIEVDAIISDLRSSCGVSEAQLLIKAVGFTILDSILLANQASFYVCHHGTVQHKIGWMTKTPGIVHTNLRALRINPGPWVAEQADCKDVPVYFSESLIGDSSTTSVNEDENDTSRLFDDYRFLDVRKSIEFCMENITGRLIPIVITTKVSPLPLVFFKRLVKSAIQRWIL